MKKSAWSLLGVGGVVLAGALGTTAVAGGGGGDERVPHYVVDPSWPKQLPNNWLVGQIGGLAVDKHDHIWVNQRPLTLTDDEIGAVPNPPTRLTPRSICCVPAPSVMEFDRPEVCAQRRPPPLVAR